MRWPLASRAIWWTYASYFSGGSPRVCLGWRRRIGSGAKITIIELLMLIPYCTVPFLTPILPKCSSTSLFWVNFCTWATGCDMREWNVCMDMAVIPSDWKEEQLKNKAIHLQYYWEHFCNMIKKIRVDGKDLLQLTTVNLQILSR